MSFVTLHQVGILTPIPLFKNLNFTIAENQRIGIVAGNGGGKSSLLRCIAGLDEPTDGFVSYSQNIRIGYVEQNIPDQYLGLSFFDCLKGALPDEQQSDDWRVEIFMDSFEIPKEFHELAVHKLSGGWQRMMLIARTLISEPDVLLLDEPTNHLDTEKILFLEKWLSHKCKKLPMVMVSHDRQFLNNCTTQTLFLRPDESKLYAHSYDKAKQLLSEDDLASASKFARDVKEAQRLQRSANELKNIGVNSRSDAAQKKAKQLAARADNLVEALKEVHKERSGLIRLKSSDSISRVTLSMNNVTVTKPDGTPLFNTGQFKILQGDRIAIVGENGAGKSRFIKLVHDSICKKIDTPNVVCSPSIVMGYADQHMTQLPEHKTAFDFLTGQFSIGDQRARTVLAGAGFTIDRMHQPIKLFSQGQRARLGMLVLRLTEPNFYLLDEPTNHVDILGQEMLETEILNQQATCLFVTHDRSFQRAIATRVFRIEKGRLVEEE